MEQDDEQQRQQADSREKERDGDGLVIAPVEVMRGRVQPDERQPEDEERARDAAHGVVPPVGGEVEEAAADEEKRAEIQRDLRVGQRAALDDPVVFARVERAIRRAQALGLVRIDQPQAQPLADLLQVRRDAHAERRRVHRRPRQHRSPVEKALQVGAMSSAD